MSCVRADPYHSSDRFPVRAVFNAVAGRFYLVRLQNACGVGAFTKYDLTPQQPVFALDFGSIQKGFAFYSPGTVLWAEAAPFGAPMPVPPSNDHKAGFRVKIFNSDFGEKPLEWISTARVTGQAIEDVWQIFSSSRQSKDGKIPVVILAGIRPVTTNYGTFYAPLLLIQRWIDRCSNLFGPRSVPISSGVPHKNPKAKHKPPPAARLADRSSTALTF